MPDAPLEAVLLDMGGVLLDMVNGRGRPLGTVDWRGREAMLRVLRDAGGRASEEELEHWLFAPWERDYERRYERGREADLAPHLERLVAESGTRAGGAELLAAWFRPYAEQVKPIPGAREAVAELAERGYALAVVSNVPLPGDLYRRLLARHGFVAAEDDPAPFGALLFSYDEGHRKPSPAMLRRALDRLGVEPGRAVMVGDRRASDVAAGRAAGVRTVWIESERADGPRPDATVGSLAELPAWLAGGFGDRDRVAPAPVPGTAAGHRRSAVAAGVGHGGADATRSSKREDLDAGDTGPVALGVAGGTGSGKTTVARRILRQVGEERIAFLAQDSYYRDIEWESEEQLLAHNFDHPRALDHDLLLEHVRELKAGRPVEVPIYDFVTHRRTERTRRVEPRPVILLEGILLFAEPRLRRLLDFKIYVDTDADVRFIRRLRRDLAERGRSTDDVVRQYLATVRPMHLEFVEPSKHWADVIVPEGGENRVAMGMVVARVEELLRDEGGGW